MGDAPASGKLRASRWETLGSWLGIWTPPRDVEVPPVPRRALAIGALLIAVFVVVLVTVVVPAIDTSKRLSAAEEARRDAANRRALRAHLVAEQRPHHGRAPRTAALYSRGRVAAARTAMLTAVTASVDRDARARASTGALDGTIRTVRCRPRLRPRAARMQMTCLAVTTESVTGPHGVVVGHPFLAAGSLRDGRYAWCKDNPQAGEGLATATVHVEPARVCVR